MPTTHKQLILNHLQENGTVTSWEAIKLYGNTRLSGTIHSLRKDGHDIGGEMIPFKNRYGSHSQFMQYQLQKQKQ